MRREIRVKDKKIGQLEAASYIRVALESRGARIASRSMEGAEGSGWLVFEQRGRSVGIDPEGGVWARASSDTGWRCIEKPCTVGGALLAVEFLIKG